MYLTILHIWASKVCFFVYWFDRLGYSMISCPETIYARKRLHNLVILVQYDVHLHFLTSLLYLILDLCNRSDCDFIMGLGKMEWEEGPRWGVSQWWEGWRKAFWWWKSVIFRRWIEISISCIQCYANTLTF